LSTEATHLIALRHGQTAWNAEMRIQGQLDVPLDSTGQQQARLLAQALADADIDVVYSSDLSRAAGTAAALTAITGQSVLTDSSLRERGFGIFEGLTYAEVDQRWPEQAQRWRRRDPDFGPAGGETLKDFDARAIAAYTRLVQRHPGQVVAVFAHGGLLDSLYRAATHQPLTAPRTWELGNARINRVLFNGGGFSLVGWNDDAHLKPLT